MTQRQSAAGHASKAWSFDQWPLRRKLAAALIFPVLLAFALGGLRVKSDYEQAQRFASAADSTVLLRPLVEFNLSVQRMASSSAPGGQGLKASAGVYDRAARAVSGALQAADTSETVASRTEEALSLGRAVRAAASQTGAFSVAIDKSASTASLVSGIVGDLALNDATSVKALVALQDTIAAQRAMTGQQLNLANTDDASGAQKAVKLVGAEASFVSRLRDETGVTHGSDVRQLINENTGRGVYLQGAALDKDQLGVVAATFERSNAAYGSLVDRQLTELETSLRAQASGHRTQALVNMALVVGALLAALFIVLALLRSLLIPIRAVRQGALDIARNKLPEAVRRIRDGEEPPAPEPIPVHTREEMGQLARAVDDLHQQALSLAGEQARLRVQVGSMFETLSRRSTSLIDQQLSLIERLESDEEDPQRLQSLFRLDHLAARMRRNSDSLLVLAGTSTRRGSARSVSVADAVRAAVSEVEDYQRIDIGETSDDQVLSAVGSDLIHMVAEIVDNALSYSPPTSRVTIRGARTSDGGLLVEVKDRGLGMPAAELAALNERLANGGDITTDTARRMGLFVVGSLAKRHGIGVRLRRNEDADRSGVTVSVHLPAALLADSGQAAPDARPAARALNGHAAQASSAPRPNGSPVAGGPAGRPHGSSAPNGAPAEATASPAPTAPTEPAAPGKGVNGLPVRKPMATRITDLTGGDPAAASRTGEPGHNGSRAGSGLPARAQAGDTADQAADVVAAAPQASEETADVPRSSAGLPVRRPMATGITEHTGTPATRAEAAADQSGRKWLRRQTRKSLAAEEAGAAVAADEAAEHRMPANLSAWLDHRAKLTAARAQAASGEEDASPEVDAVPSANEAADLQSTHPSTSREEFRAFETDGGLQRSEVAAEAAGAQPEPSSQPAAVTPPPALSEQDPADAPTELSTGLPRRRPGASGMSAAAAPATTPEVPWLGSGASAQPAGSATTAGEEPGLPVRTPGASGVLDSSSLPVPSHEDTPIFRAMGTTWLTDSDGGHVDPSRSPAADGTPSTAARFDAAEPAQDAPSGLPVRRPGRSFTPGATDAPEPQQPPARAGRDPESIRRSLNRHQTGVSSARSQTPLTGTPDREEADVPR